MRSKRAPQPSVHFKVKDRFTFKTEMDDEARSNMFRHLIAKA